MLATSRRYSDSSSTPSYLDGGGRTSSNFHPVSIRESLIEDKLPRYTAFSARPRSPTISKISAERNESSLSFRNYGKDASYPLNGFQTWKDAGQLEPFIPQKFDPDYDANIWRHFSPESRGLSPHVSADLDRKAQLKKGGEFVVTTAIADQHPVRIPPPSRMGSSCTYYKFMEGGNIYKDQNLLMRDLAIVDKQLKEMKILQLRSEARIPPTDERGRILPPRQYRRYQAQGRIRHLPGRNFDRYPTERDVQSNQLVLSFPNRSTQTHHVKSRRGTTLWKLTYKENVRNYNEVCKRQENKNNWKSQQNSLLPILFGGQAQDNTNN